MKEDIEKSLTTLETNKNKILNIVAALTVAVFSVYALWFNLIGSSISTDPAHWGEFGDYIGGILNPIFGFFTVIMLLYTLIQQQKSLLLSQRELELSRKELELTRSELEGSKDALKAQSDSFLIQNFESRLFNLLTNLLETCKSIRFDYDPPKTLFSNPISAVGYEALGYILTTKSENAVGVLIKSIDKGFHEYNDEDHKIILKEIHRYLLTGETNRILKKLKIIMNFISKSNFHQKTKDEYFEIVLSNINSPLLKMFYLHTAFNEEARLSIADSQVFSELTDMIHVDNYGLRKLNLKVLAGSFPDTVFGNNPYFSHPN